MLVKSSVLLCFFASLVTSHSGKLEKYGPFELILYSHLLKCNHDKTLNIDVSDISIHFFDFSRDIQVAFPLNISSKSILDLVDLDLPKSWVIFVPGFNSPVYGKNGELLKDAIKTLGNTYYITIDHYLYTNIGSSYKKSYEKSVKYAYYIAEAITGFLTDLYKGGVPFPSVRFIGHSLGSQIMGYVGFLFQKANGISLTRITALDPAGPCFSNNLIEEQVRSGAANYVEVYHCNAGGLGSASVLGDADFFINNRGEFQPDCHVPLIPGFLDSPKAAKCSHIMCIKMYAATIVNKDLFVAQQCDSYKSFKKGFCDDDSKTIAGFWSPGTARGVYYFSTEGYDFATATIPV